MDNEVTFPAHSQTYTVNLMHTTQKYTQRLNYRSALALIKGKEWKEPSSIKESNNIEQSIG
jgi:hypothetical protein